MDIKRFLVEILETFITSLIVLLLIYSTIALPEMVYGSSMEPNFKTGDRILVDRVSKLYNKSFKRGEIIVFKSKENSTHLIKRIIGLPGDIFKIYDCKVFISDGTNSYILEEFYLDSDVCTKGNLSIQDGRSFRIPENNYVAMGDNRENSYDSRALGLITIDDMIGRVVFRFWPIDKIGFVN